MKNYLICYYDSSNSYIELLHERSAVLDLIKQTVPNNYIIVEQRAGEEWFDYQKRCKKRCKEIANLKQLENLLDVNFFCSRQFDQDDDDAWILSFPASDICSLNCQCCLVSELKNKEDFAREPLLFIRIYESDFPPMRYFIPVVHLTIDQVTGDWTLQRVKERCCLEWRHAKILDIDKLE